MLHRLSLAMLHGLSMAFCVVLSHVAFAEKDPLPSWKDSNAKTAIENFVGRVTKPGSADFVAQRKRIAVFDNDGTLWAEQPYYFQLAFAFDRIKALAKDHPEWKEKQPFKAVLEGDAASLAAIGTHGLLEIIAATHAGLTTEQFATVVDDWFATARHPTLHRPYTELVYQPMLELLAYLRDHGFKTFIVSGGGVEFMRRFAENVYDIPPEQVIGSSGAVTFKMQDNGVPVLIKEPKVEFVDDGAGKPVGINRFIGRRPIFAFGNSDGDQQMLEWTAAGKSPRFMALLHHTDGVREWAYDRQSKVGKLDKALKEAMSKGWIVVDMKRDWETVFPFSN